MIKMEGAVVFARLHLALRILSAVSGCLFVVVDCFYSTYISKVRLIYFKLSYLDMILKTG